MLRNNIFYYYIAPGNGSCKHKCSCLNLVRDNRIGCAVKLVNALNTDNICTGTLNVGSHRVEEVSHVNNMWLFCRILNYSIAFCQNRCKHNVDCSTY